MKIISFLQTALLAGGIAALLNLIIYFIARSSGGINNNVILPPGKPLGIVPVIFSSVIPAIIAGLVLFGLYKFTGSPVKIFTIIALIILVASLFGPFTLPVIPAGARFTLALMHIAAGSVIIYMLRNILS